MLFTKKGKTFRPEKAARQFMAYIQIIVVQQIADEAEKQGIPAQDMGVLALLHGIALLFISLEHAEKDELILHDDVLRIKEQVIIANMNFAFHKRDITSERVEGFTRIVYDILTQSGCDGSTPSDQAMKAVEACFCNVCEFEDSQRIHEIFGQLQRCFDEDLYGRGKL